MVGIIPARRRRRDSLLDFIEGPAEFFDDLFGFSELELPKLEWTMPMVNTRDVEGGVEVEVAAPGLAKSDFDIAVEGKKLRVSVERKEENTEEGESGYKRREFNYSSFERIVVLPQSAEASEVKASYEDGLLIVSVPFEGKQDRVKVEVK